MNSKGTAAEHHAEKRHRLITMARESLSTDLDRLCLVLVLVLYAVGCYYRSCLCAEG